MNNPHVEINQTDTSSASTKIHDIHDETELESSGKPSVSTDATTHVIDTNRHTDEEKTDDSASKDDENGTNDNDTKVDENENKHADSDDAQDDKKTDEEAKATTDETNTDTDEEKLSPASTSTSTPTVNNEIKSEGVCWICYETLCEGNTNGATDTVIHPCKCKGTLGGVHQECLLAWMAQTNATTCPHCNYAYDLEEQYPSTLQQVCDHPWLPTCMSAIICATMFYLFHRIWRRFTRRKTNHHLRKNPPMSSTRLLSMMGGGLPSPFMMPQMNDIMGTASSTLFQKPSFNLSSIIAEIELFALSVMILYAIVRYTHQYCSPRPSNNLSSENADEPSATPIHFQYLNSFSSNLHTFWSLVDDIWAQRASGTGQLNHDEAFYMMPFDILTTLFYVIQHACKQTQRWAVDKTMVVRTYEPTSNTPGLSVH